MELISHSNAYATKELIVPTTRAIADNSNTRRSVLKSESARSPAGAAPGEVSFETINASEIISQCDICQTYGRLNPNGIAALSPGCAKRYPGSASKIFSTLKESSAELERRPPA